LKQKRAGYFFEIRIKLLLGKVFIRIVGPSIRDAATPNPMPVLAASLPASPGLALMRLACRP